MEGISMTHNSYLHNSKTTCFTSRDDRGTGRGDMVFLRKGSLVVPSTGSGTVIGVDQGPWKTKKPWSIAVPGLQFKKKWRPPTLPHCIAVPSAQAGLTSLFGMGRGGTPLQ